MADAVADKAGGWLSSEATIVNSKGLHARPAAKIAKLAATYRAEMTVAKGDVSVSARSIMGLMMLAASAGTVLILSARGRCRPPQHIKISLCLSSGWGFAIRPTDPIFTINDHIFGFATMGFRPVEVA